MSSLTWKKADNLLFLTPGPESDGQACVAPITIITAPPNRLETHQYHAKLINRDLHHRKTFRLVDREEGEYGAD